MKHLHYFIMSVACAALLLSGCHKDDDDEGDGSQIERSSKKVSFSSTLVNVDSEKQETFSTSDATFYTTGDTEFSESGFSGASTIFNSKSMTAIVGKKSGKILTIMYLGTGSSTDGRSYSGSIATVKNRDSYASSAIENILKGKETSDKERQALEALNIESYYSAQIIYKNKEDNPGSETFYYSTTAKVTVSVYTPQFITGAFSATLTNTEGDTFIVSDGVFNVLGKD